MPYALFCNDAKLSKTYPSGADVWKVAQRSGLVRPGLGGRQGGRASGSAQQLRDPALPARPA